MSVSDFFTFADQEHDIRAHSCKLLGGVVLMCDKFDNIILLNVL
jgi:hypothetical protein